MSSSTSSHAPGNREGVAKKRSVRPTEEEASDLWKLQEHISSSPSKTQTRNRMLTILNARGITQRVLAGIISDAAESCDRPAISEHGVQKAIRDYVERYGVSNIGVLK